MILRDLHRGKMNKSFQFELPNFKEEDGKLGTFEPQMLSGFDVKRMIYIYDVPEGEDRANHACMNGSMLFIAIAGSVKLSIECCGDKLNYLLNDKIHAVYVPPASWIRVYDFSRDAVLLGLSDKRYKDCCYSNNYSEYRRLVGEET